MSAKTIAQTLTGEQIALLVWQRKDLMVTILKRFGGWYLVKTMDGPFSAVHSIEFFDNNGVLDWRYLDIEESA